MVRLLWFLLCLATTTGRSRHYKRVPAKIIDELSSDDVVVREGDTVVLVCNVTGVPTPEVTWYRRPASSKSSAKEQIGLSGEVLIIKNVSRYCDDIYECVAYNGVNPAAHKQMRVTVEFAPEIRLPTRRIGQAVGKDTILECVITAYPQANNYWERNGKRITSTNKYRIEAYDEGDHTMTLSMRVQDIGETDYGSYKCVAANGLGMDEEEMFLYEYVEPELEPAIKPTDPIVVIKTTSSSRGSSPQNKYGTKPPRTVDNTINKVSPGMVRGGENGASSVCGGLQMALLVTLLVTLVVEL